MSFGKCCCDPVVIGEIVNPAGLYSVGLQLQHFGWPAFINAREWVPATSAAYPARHGTDHYLRSGITLTFADVNAGGAPSMSRAGGITELPALNGFPAHPEVGYLLASCAYSASAWRGGLQQVRTQQWTGGFYEHASGQIIRRRASADSATYYRAKRRTTDIVNGIFGAAGRDPAALAAWWEVVADPGDANVVNSYNVAQFFDRPDWATLNDRKFLFKAGALRLFKGVIEGRMAAGPEGDAHVADAGTNLSAGLPNAIKWQVVAHHNLDTHTWVAPIDTTVVYTAAVQTAVPALLKAGAFVSYGTAASIIRYYRVLVDTVPAGDPSALPAKFQVFNSFAVPEDSTFGDQQTINALTEDNTALSFLNFRDQTVPHRYLKLTATTKFVSLWGYEEGLSSVTAGGVMSHARDFTVDPLTGAPAVPDLVLAQPLVEPTLDLVTGSGSKGTLRYYQAAGFSPLVGPRNCLGEALPTGWQGHTTYLEWQGAPPTFIKPGEYIDIEVWQDFNVSDYDDMHTPIAALTGDWKLRGTWRVYATEAQHWPRPIVNGVPGIDVAVVTNFRGIPFPKRRDMRTGPCSGPAIEAEDFILPTLDWQITDNRTLSQAESVVFPSNGGLVLEEFESRGNTQRLTFATHAVSWCTLRLTINGVLYGDIGVDPHLAVVWDLQLDDENTREVLLMNAQGLVDALDLEAAACTGARQFTPRRVDGIFARMQRGGFCWAKFWNNCVTTRSPDGNESCAQINLREPGVTIGRRILPNNQIRFYWEGPSPVPVNRTGELRGEFVRFRIGSSRQTPASNLASEFNGCVCAP